MGIRYFFLCSKVEMDEEQEYFHLSELLGIYVYQFVIRVCCLPERVFGILIVQIIRRANKH